MKVQKILAEISQQKAGFTDLIEELIKKQEEKGGKVIMCEYIDMLEARGEARGIQKGEAINEAAGKIKGENRLYNI